MARIRMEYKGRNLFIKKLINSGIKKTTAQTYAARVFLPPEHKYYTSAAVKQWRYLMVGYPLPTFKTVNKVKFDPRTSQEKLVVNKSFEESVHPSPQQETTQQPTSQRGVSEQESHFLIEFVETMIQDPRLDDAAKLVVFENVIKKLKGKI